MKMETSTKQETKHHHTMNGYIITTSYSTTTFLIQKQSTGSIQNSTIIKTEFLKQKNSVFVTYILIVNRRKIILVIQCGTIAQKCKK